jgi:hypothetical protein
MLDENTRLLVNIEKQMIMLLMIGFGWLLLVIQIELFGDVWLERFEKTDVESKLQMQHEVVIDFYQLDLLFVHRN